MVSRHLRRLACVFVGTTCAVAACSTGTSPTGVAASSSSAGGSGSAAGGAMGLGGIDLTTSGEGGRVCDGGVADAPPEASGCDASASVAFAATVFPILVGCTGELCHGAWAYDSVVDQPTRECCDGRLLVAPGDPAHSYLLDKIRDHDLCSGAPMPLGGPMLPDAKLQAISDWICEGAQND